MELLIGAVISLIVEGIKKWLGPTEYVTLATVAVLAFAAASAQFILQRYGLWDTFLQILITAGAFYAFIIKRFEPKS